MACHRLVDHRGIDHGVGHFGGWTDPALPEWAHALVHRHGRLGIGGREHSALEQTHSHDAEVIGRHGVSLYQWAAHALKRSSSDGGVIVAAAFERHAVAEGGGFHTGDAAGLLQQRLGETEALQFRGIVGLGKLERGRPDAVGAHSDIHAAQPREILQQEAGGNQQQQGERDLARHQCVAGEAASSSRADRTPGAALQLLMQIGTRRLQRGEDAEQRARHQRYREGEGHRHPVELNDIELRHGEALQAGEQRDDRPPQAEPEDAADRGQQKAFGEQLLHQSPPARAQRTAYRHLLLACDRSRKQQVRHVGAGDQQHQADGRQHHEQRGAGAPRQILMQRHHGRAHLVVGVRILLFQAGGDESQVGLCLPDTDARLHPADCLGPVAAPGAESFGIHVQRDPELRP